MENYWKDRCLLAEKAISLIHKHGEIEAFDKWHECKDEEKDIVNQHFCNKTLINNLGVVCFKQHKVYAQIGENPVVFINEHGEKHVPGGWSKYFIKITD